MRFFLVCNPESRNGSGRKLSEDYFRLLDQEKVAYDYAFTKTLPDAEYLTRNAVSSGVKTVVAVGGDGTINRVLTGLFSEGKDQAGAAMGVLYAGTSPDFCAFHEIPINKREAVKTLLSENFSLIDVCRVSFLGNDGLETTSFFTCSANAGLGPKVAGAANRCRCWLGDIGGTFCATVASVLSNPIFSGQLVVDKDIFHINDCWNVTVGKNPFLASGLKLEIQMGPADGKLYVFALKGIGRLKLLTLLPKIYTGKVVHDEKCLVAIGRKVRLNSNTKGTGLEFDGDPRGYLPAEIEVLPAAVKLAGGRHEGT